jgi:hypothetical protein
MDFENIRTPRSESEVFQLRVYANPRYCGVASAEVAMTLLKLAGILIVIAVVGPLVWTYRLFPESDFVVSVTAFAIGVVTFLGVMDLNRSTRADTNFRDENVRASLACSLVLTYLFIVCFTAFVRTAPESETGKVTLDFMHSFSQIIGVTIAFYFGASAIAQVFARRDRDNAPPSST